MGVLSALPKTMDNCIEACVKCARACEECIQLHVYKNQMYKQSEMFATAK